MADNGGGHFYFAGDVAQMRDHITSEVGETLEVVAREVVAGAGAARSPSGWTRSRRSAWSRPAAGRGSSSATWCPARCSRSPCASCSTTGRWGARSGVRVAGRGPGRRVRRRRPGRPRRCSLAWTYADHARERRPAAGRGGGPGRRPAVRGAGQAGGRAAQPRGPLSTTPRQALEGVRKRVGGYAGSDARSCAAGRAELSEEQVHFAAPMPELARKAGATSRRAREPDADRDGKARRA